MFTPEVNLNCSLKALQRSAVVRGVLAAKTDVGKTIKKLKINSSPKIAPNFFVKFLKFCLILLPARELRDGQDCYNRFLLLLNKLRDFSGLKRRRNFLSWLCFL